MWLRSTLFIRGGGYKKILQRRLLGNFGSSFRFRSRKLFLQMVRFSQARLEGRALEHALAGDKGTHVRMYDEGVGQWIVVNIPEKKVWIL